MSKNHEATQALSNHSKQERAFLELVLFDKGFHKWIASKGLDFDTFFDDTPYGELEQLYNEYVDSIGF